MELDGSKRPKVNKKLEELLKQRDSNPSCHDSFAIESKIKKLRNILKEGYVAPIFHYENLISEAEKEIKTLQEKVAYWKERKIEVECIEKIIPEIF